VCCKRPIVLQKTHIVLQRTHIAAEHSYCAAKDAYCAAKDAYSTSSSGWCNPHVAAHITDSCKIIQICVVQRTEKDSKNNRNTRRAFCSPDRFSTPNLNSWGCVITSLLHTPARG
jgi:hypothetical protein